MLRKFKHYLGNVIRYLYYMYLRSMGVVIGNNTMISLGAKLDVRRGKIVIGDDCLITWGAVVLSHDASQLLAGNIEKSQATTIVENGVFIGVNSVILPGVRIGEKSVVGAGSVVTKDVAPQTLVAGNPARVIRQLAP